VDHASPTRAAYALGLIEGFPFERFVGDFMSALLGAEFVPTGPLADGGADGILTDGEGRFLQSSVRDDLESKIRQTVARLREVGREPKQLIHATSKDVRLPDLIEEKLTEELNVTIKIRDASYFKGHLNDSTGTIAAYANHLHALTLDLERGAQGALVSQSLHVKDPSVFVFLAQEADDAHGSQSLMNDVVDSLILWALEGTDPDRDILMSEPEILTKILGALPSVENLLRPRLPKRLGALSSKGSGGGRRVRAHRKERQYCLPFETRESLANDIAEDVAIRQEVAVSLRNRIESDPQFEPPLTAVEIAKGVDTALRALQLTFEKQGISFMSTLGPSLASGDSSDTASSDPETGAIYVVDHVSAALDEFKVDGTGRTRIGEAALAALRGVIFGSTSSERTYLRKLSKTYTLLFTLSLEPRLINYFQQMTGKFYLYVGADQLVRAMSEAYLEPSDQVVTNTLKMAARAGAIMVLAEPVLSEVMHNLRSSDTEYRNTFAPLNDSAPYDIVRNSPKILVRAYMYARLGMGIRKPSSWQAFVNQYCDHPDLHKPAAFEALRRFFQAEYGFEYRSSNELAVLVDGKEWDSLTSSLVAGTEKSDVLASNDALLALSVYGQRRRNHETSNISEFGFNTWWLTEESQILRHTRDLVAKHHGARYIMRPEFLLNFLTLAPSAASARDAFRDVFPSLLGVNLARRVPQRSFHDLLDRIHDADDLSEARRAAKLSDLADKLKGNFARTYLSTHDSQGATTGVDFVADRKIEIEMGAE